MNYISELQKEKALPLGDKADELVILTEYDNGYFQFEEFKNIMGESKIRVKQEFRYLVDNAYTYIRNPDAITAK